LTASAAAANLAAPDLNMVMIIASSHQSADHPPPASLQTRRDLFRWLAPVL
jgi:hypothetical protein